MKILHTSDWHLGRSLYRRKHYEEFSAFLDWLTQTIEEKKVEALMVAGDVFDTSTPSNRVQELYYRFLCRVAASCCRSVVVVAGNHDSPSSLNAPKELLRALNVYVVGSMTEALEDEVFVLQTDDNPEVIVCAVPYLPDKDIRAVEPGETIEDKNAKLVEGLKNHYADVCAIAEQKRTEFKRIVKFSDIFHENGWKAIAVNDFFDSIINNDQIVSSKSLHGILLQRYWAGNIDDWNHEVDEQLTDCPCSSETRSKGKQNHYEIGTTVAVRKDASKFLCVALSHTDISNNETQSSSSDLHQAVRGLLQKARSICGNESLTIPLMGSGLSRVEIKSNILVYLILTAIFEESRNKKVTGEIHFVLPKEKASEINLGSLQKDWS